MVCHFLDSMSNAIVCRSSIAFKAKAKPSKNCDQASMTLEISS